MAMTGNAVGHPLIFQFGETWNEDLKFLRSMWLEQSTLKGLVVDESPFAVPG